MQWCRFMLSIGGWIICNLPQLCRISDIGGMNLNHNFFHVSKFSEDQKKRSSPKIEAFLSPKSRKDQNKGPNIIQRSDADVNHSQIIGGNAVKLLGGIYPPSPLGFRHPCQDASTLIGCSMASSLTCLQVFFSSDNRECKITTSVDCAITLVHWSVSGCYFCKNWCERPLVSLPSFYSFRSKVNARLIKTTGNCFCRCDCSCGVHALVEGKSLLTRYKTNFCFFLATSAVGTLIFEHMQELYFFVLF